MEDALQAAEIFPRQPKVFTVNFSESARQWGAPGQSLYDAAPSFVKHQIELLAEGMVPSREGRSFPRTRMTMGATLGRLLGR